MTNRWESCVVISIGVGMTATFCFLLFGPQDREMTAMLTSTQNLRYQLGGRATAAGRLSEIKAERQQAASMLHDFRTRIPVTPEVGTFVEEISAIAQHLSLRARRIVPLSPQRHGPVTVLPVQMSFTSSFADSFDFVRDVERLPRAVQVSDLVVERIDADEESTEGAGGDLRTELTMRIFYEPT